LHSIDYPFNPHTMMFRYSTIVPTLLLASQVTSAIVMPQRAVALSAVEVNMKAYKVSVQIIGGNSVGTGTIVRQEGDRYTVLTAAHVLRQTSIYKLIAPDGQSYPIVDAKFASTPSAQSGARGLDIAAITFISPQEYDVATIGDSATTKIGEPIYTVGFPGSQPNYTFSKAIVEANSNANFRQGYSLLYQCDKIAPGMSGGGVFNRRGELIAMTGMSIGAKGADIQEGLGVGITSRRFVPWATAVNIPLNHSLTEPFANRTTADDFLISAMDKIDRRDVRGAIADYSRAISLKPDYAIAYYRRGLSRERIGDRAGAIADYSSAISLKPNWSEVYLSRGLNRGILGDWKNSLADYDLAILMRGDNPFAYTVRGLNRSILGDLNGALADYSRAIELRPHYANTYKERAAIKEKLGDRAGAIADYTQAISLKPYLAQAYEQRGMLKQEINDSQGAMRDLTIAARLYQQQGNLSAYRQSISQIQRLKNQ
jgi:Flp pilus assembly protein TadD